MAKKYRSVLFLNSNPGGVGGGGVKGDGREGIAGDSGDVGEDDTMLGVRGSDGVVGVRMIPGSPYCSK